jgi:hypothetical protein
MACLSDADQSKGSTRCCRAPPAAEAETFRRTRPRISDTVQPLRGPRSDVNESRRAATQPRSFAARAWRGAGVVFGTGPGNQARTTPLARESARESPFQLGTSGDCLPHPGGREGSDSLCSQGQNPGAAADLEDPISRALGALGRRFESCRPD